MNYVSGPYTQGQLLKSIDQVEIALTQEFLKNGAITSKFDQQYWRDRVIDASFGRNTVLYDDMDYPSVMVIIEHNRQSLIDGPRGNITHPAFVVNGQLKPRIYVSKYQNMVVGEFNDRTARPLSLKGVDARGNYSLNGTSIICKDKGPGWHLLTNAEFAAIALECWNNEFFPRGNTDYGRSSEVHSEAGVPSFIRTSDQEVLRVLTGSGPISWSHDGSPYGIYDIHGNMRERVAGLQFVNREINIIPNNDAAAHNADIMPESELWRSILSNGNLVEPGTSGSLGFVHSGGWKIKEDTTPLDSLSTASFAGISPYDESVIIPDILKSLAIYPKNKLLPSPSIVTIYGEGLSVVTRGGSWESPDGFISIRATNEAIDYYHSIGFRTAYIEGV